MIINLGTQERLISESVGAAGTTIREGSILSDSLLATLWVNSITSGSLTVSIYTLTDTGKEALLFSFPALVAPSTTLVLQKSGISLQRFRVQATYTGACDYEVYIRAVSGAGSASQDVNIINQPISVTVDSGDIDVHLQPPSTWQTSQVTVTTSAAILIPAVLFDRKGLLVKNWSTGTDVYLGENLAAANTASGYPLSARDGIAIDLASGSAIYAVTSTGSADVRIVQAGS